MGDFKCGKLTGIPAVRHKNALIPAKTVCDLVSESRMRLTFNAVDNDGLTYNGLTFNGLTFNGLNFNGLTFNGLSFNGLTFNGLNFQGATFNKPVPAAVEELNRQTQETIEKLPVILPLP